jgi:hypothetical protein
MAQVGLQVEAGSMAEEEVARQQALMTVLVVAALEVQAALQRSVSISLRPFIINRLPAFVSPSRFITPCKQKLTLQRAGGNTLRPVTIKQILDAQQAHPDAEFRIDGIEASQVSTLSKQNH